MSEEEGLARKEEHFTQGLEEEALEKRRSIQANCPKAAGQAGDQKLEVAGEGACASSLEDAGGQAAKELVEVPAKAISDSGLNQVCPKQAIRSIEEGSALEPKEKQESESEADHQEPAENIAVFAIGSQAS